MATYNIYPSLLDRIQSYIDCEELYNQYWGNSDQPAKTLDEFRAEQRQAVLDMINRVPHEPVKAASCGTAFNELVDSLQERRTAHEGVTVGMDDGCFAVGIDGYTFRYDTRLVQEAVAAYEGCINQDYLEYTLDVDGSTVRLYGYADKWTPQHCIDLKTVKSYTQGRYAKGWQRYVYPLALRESRGVTVESFRYDVYEWANDRVHDLDERVLTATYYCEEYTLDYGMLRETLHGFMANNVLPLLEVMRDEITDTRIITY